MKTGKVVLLVVGTILSLLGMLLGAAALILGVLYVIQRDKGYLTTPTETFRTASSALLSERVDLFLDEPAPPGFRTQDIGRFLVRATATAPEREIFVGIGPTRDVEAYLANVAHTVITEVQFDPFDADYREIPGDEPAAAPNEQPFWDATAVGAGTQQAQWPVREGSWTVVVMNADGSPGVDVRLQAGAHIDLLGPLALGALAGAVVLLILGLPLLLAGAIGLGRHGPPPAHRPAYGAADATPTPAPQHQVRAYPVHLRGELDEPLCRWLWLVKWIIAIPHYLVLFFLNVAFVFATLAAGVAIVVTGRYPRALFDFNVGVLRWNWRVAFYTYSALGTDRYPPFSLHRTDYPADLEVDYPQRLSRGLVLIKWWLLAIPHYLVLAVLAGGWLGGWSIGIATGNGADNATGNGTWAFGSLLGVLVLFAALAVLFTGTYPRGLFDFVMGINRWLYRVWAYAALMRDEYPPFHFDQGPHDPGERADTTPPPGPAASSSVPDHLSTREPPRL